MDSANVNTFLQTSDTNLTKPDNNKMNFLKEQDRFLPIANISKIMKKDLPSSAKIAKEAKECIQECASEFISFISSEAAECCQKDKRKTINGEDILIALVNLGFDNYVEPLQNYLQQYREMNKFESGLMEMSNGNGEIDNSELTMFSNDKSGRTRDKPNLLNVPKLLSMLPLTDLTSNSSVSLEELLKDVNFQRAVMNRLKTPRIDDDCYIMNDDDSL